MRIRWAVLLIALAVALAACVQESVPPPRPAAPLAVDRETEALLRLGEERLAQGRPLEAGDAFQAVLTRSPNREKRARATLGLARADRAQGNYVEALGRVQDLLAQGVGPDQAVQANLLAAGLEMDLSRPGKAASRLRLMLSRPPGPLSKTERFQAQMLLAQALAKAGRGGEAAAQLVRLSEGADASQLRELSDRMLKVAGLARSNELLPLLGRVTWPELKSALLIGLTEAYVREGRLREAERSLATLRAEPSAGRWSGRLKDLDSQVRQAKLVKPRAVGVILPLSGRYKAFGKRMLAAVELGLGLFSNVGAQPPTLFIEDSRSDAAIAARAVSLLVERHKVMAIIGPVGAAASLSAARRAQQLGVPLISLSQVAGVTMAGPYVFQNSFTPEAQAKALLNQVMDKQGLRRIAVLAPSNSYGQGFARIMSGQLAARGGSLVRTEYYPTDKTDFAPYIKSLVKLPPGNYRPGHPESPKPVIDFDALFLPTGPEAAAMIAPQLAYYDVLGVQVMGTNLWHNPKLIEQGGRYVENCLFPDAFDPGSQSPLARAFVREFGQAVGQQPGVMEAQCYDAAYILRHMLMSSLAPSTRPAMRERLARLQGLQGVCGVLSVDQERRVNKQLTLFTVQSGQFTPLGMAARPLMPRDPLAQPQTQEIKPVKDQIEMKFNKPSEGTVGQSTGSAESSREEPVNPSVIPAKPMPLMPAPAADIPR
jgi:ABC-type branched-subunit amino acid transport system substrate-binding protein